MLQENKTLQFAIYQKGDRLQLNKYGIQEPVPTAKRIDIHQLDIVIMPLVAFDQAGRRLGAGGGYYDRTFAERRGLCLLGLGYAVQEADSLPQEPWDVLMTGVVTEKGIKNMVHSL